MVLMMWGGDVFDKYIDHMIKAFSKCRVEGASLYDKKYIYKKNVELID